MKVFLLIFGFLLNIQIVFGQSFEGKLTYVSKRSSSEKLDTLCVHIRGDSIRFDLAERLNVSTYLYFLGINQYWCYSKRDKAYLSYPIIQSDTPKTVLAYELKHNQDSITLYYSAKSLNKTLNVEILTTSILNLHPQLQVQFLKGIYVEPVVLNGSGYLPIEIKNSFVINEVNEQRSNQSRLIAIDYTKPSIELFEMKKE